MLSSDPADLRLALDLCDRADHLTMRAFEKTDLVVETKADRSPVSEADREVELLLRDALESARPSDHVLGEEFGTLLAQKDSSRQWIIDPIDGTANFIRHLPFWATLIALEVSDEIVLGVVSAPALGRRWWAGRGLGAYTTSVGMSSPRPLGVSAVTSLTDAYILGASLNYWSDANLSPEGWFALAAEAHWDRSVGDFWTHMLVAEGSAEIGIDPIGNLWDLAALKVIVEESGGTFTDFTGAACASGGNGVSSNGRLHERALEFLSG